jgi:hypothetical protein
MPQQTIDYRRIRPGQLAALGLAPGYETMDRGSYSLAGAGMTGRHEHTRQRAALELRLRQLALIKLAAG